MNTQMVQLIVVDMGFIVTCGIVGEKIQYERRLLMGGEQSLHPPRFLNIVTVFCFLRNKEPWL